MMPFNGSGNGSSFDPGDRELASLLLEGVPLFDVRAPIEFTHGSIPGAVNLPLLNDDERAAVGTRYKTQGQDAAIQLGFELIGGDVAEKRIRSWCEFMQKNPTGRLYCFRGGLRSQSVQRALRERGIDVPLIEGGYKRARRFLLNALEEVARTERFAVLSGFTGSGKTEILRKMTRDHRVVDLEELARHRGSAFGRRAEFPPSQADFENRLSADLLRNSARVDLETPILLEDESRRIGKLEIPKAVFDRIESAPVYVIERSREERARHLIEIYLGENYSLREGDRDSGILAQLHLDLETNLQGISRRLGGLELKNLTQMVNVAIEEHARSGSLQAHMDWVMRLLERYYDPLYDFHLGKIQDRIFFRGTDDEVIRAIKERR